MARGNAKQCIFLDDVDYRQFVHILSDVVEDFAIECWNYCLMPNHYHATFLPTRANLSDALRGLNSRYALWWNRRHGRVGHVLQGRFKDQIVDREQYLLTLSRYVVMNPVRAKLVARPEDWSWSSYRATVGLAMTPAFLRSSLTLGLFGGDEDSEKVLRERFASFIAQEPDDPSLLDRIRSNERILGPKAFKDWILAR